MTCFRAGIIWREGTGALQDGYQQTVPHRQPGPSSVQSGDTAHGARDIHDSALRGIMTIMNRKEAECVNEMLKSAHDFQGCFLFLTFTSDMRYHL